MTAGGPVQRDDLSDILAQHCAVPPSSEVETVWRSFLCDMIARFRPGIEKADVIDALPPPGRMIDELAVRNALSVLGVTSGAPGILRPARGQVASWVRIVGGSPVFVAADDAADLVFLRPERGLEPTSSFMRAGTGHSWFRAFFGRFRGPVALICLLSVLIGMAAFAVPLLVIAFFDRVVMSGGTGSLPTLLLAGVGVIGAEALFRWLRRALLARLSARLDVTVGSTLLNHLLALTPDTIERAALPSQLARVKTFEGVRDFLTGPQGSLIFDLPLAGVTLLVMAGVAGKLALIPFAACVLFAILFWRLRRPFSEEMRLLAKASSARQQFVIETVEKADALRAAGLGPLWREKYVRLSEREFLRRRRLRTMTSVLEAAGQGITLSANTLMIALGAIMAMAGTLPGGALVACLILSWRVLTPAQRILALLPRVEQVRNSIGQINTLMDIESEESIATGRARLRAVRGELEFDTVRFQYEGATGEVLNDFSLHIDPGELVGLKGESGAGKATLLKLCQGYYRPTAGAIRMDGIDLRQFDPLFLRRQIGFLSRQTTLLSGTVRDNLVLVNPDATDAEIDRALSLADLDGVVARLPRGMDTFVYRLGTPSADFLLGISLARLYLHPGSILLVDQLPDSLLSTQRGERLRAFLARARGSKTVIVNTYRTDILKICSRIVTLEHGGRFSVQSDAANGMRKAA